MKTKLSLIPLLLILCACTTLDFNSQLSAAVRTNAAVRNAAADSLAVQEITKEEAQSVLKVTDEMRTFADAARIAADAGDIATAQGKLNLASSILLSLQKYLRGGKDGNRSSDQSTSRPAE
jgi:hypothetical protein